jgi:hypothetical protein
MDKKAGENTAETIKHFYVLMSWILGLRLYVSFSIAPNACPEAQLWPEGGGVIRTELR